MPLILRRPTDFRTGPPGKPPDDFDVLTNGYTVGRQYPLPGPAHRARPFLSIGSRLRVVGGHCR
jgi:hypothetical protein